MFLPLTENYIAYKFFQNCGKPFHNRSQNVYQGSCPICREGKSWLKKKRCYYIVEKNIVCCHNCGWYSSPYNWITKVTGLTFNEIKSELENTDSINFENQETNTTLSIKKETEDLPKDSINLLDKEQLEYYSTNFVVKACNDIIKKRKIIDAINRPSQIYTTLDDRVHENRLIIPFYDTNNKIIFYQSRKVLDSDTRPKYLSKVGSEKSFYGINNVKASLEYIFITEGPIDAMFIENGIAVCGITESKNNNFTETQQQQLRGFPLHKKVWVLDNQFVDSASKNKTKHLLENNETVFIWPEHLKTYKDINEYCVDKNISCFETDTILKNSYSGLKGKLLLSNY